MYSRTANEKKEAKRSSRIFYETHCVECKCKLIGDEVKRCSECAEAETNTNLFPKHIKDESKYIKEEE